MSWLLVFLVIMPALKLTTHPPRHMLTSPGDGEEAKTVEQVMGPMPANRSQCDVGRG
jgi:hypothetical protein